MVSVVIFHLFFSHSSHWASTTPWKLPRIKAAANLDTFQRPLLLLPQFSGEQLGPCLSWLSENGYVNIYVNYNLYVCKILTLCCCFCAPGSSLVSIEDPQESLFITQNVERLQDGAKSFWIGLYKNHEGESGSVFCKFLFHHKKQSKYT